jgi:hypothetical protein
VTGNDPLLDVAVALADGTAVDWMSAAESAGSDNERRLIQELQFIAGVVQPPAQWGPLKIIERVGSGTFGEVFRAWDTRLDREVALKLLRRERRAHHDTDSAVVHEGRLLARVRHPNVVAVYGAEQIGGEVGIWMEFVRGVTLGAGAGRSVVVRARQSSGRGRGQRIVGSACGRPRASRRQSAERHPRRGRAPRAHRLRRRLRGDRHRT